MAERAIFRFDPIRRAVAVRRRSPLLHVGRMLDEVSASLARPYSNRDSFFSTEERIALSQTMLGEGNLITEQHIVSKGYWHRQHGGSCGAWAIANSLAAQGRDIGRYPDRELVERLHTRSRGIQDRADNGLFVNEIASIARKTHGVSVDIALSRQLGYRNYSNTLRIISRDKESQDQVSERNAEIILSHLRQGHTFLAIVKRAAFYNAISNTSHVRHAISVVGFRKREGGFVDLQIIDPARGYAWVSWEHFFKHARDVTAISKKS